MAKSLSIALLALTIVSLPASTIARPDALGNYNAHPVLFVIPAIVMVALVSILYFSHNQDDRKAFASSCVYLAFMLMGAAVALYLVFCRRAVTLARTLPLIGRYPVPTPSVLAWRGGGLGCAWR